MRRSPPSPSAALLLALVLLLLLLLLLSPVRADDALVDVSRNNSNNNNNNNGTLVQLISCEQQRNETACHATALCSWKTVCKVVKRGTSKGKKKHTKSTKRHRKCSRVCRGKSISSPSSHAPPTTAPTASPTVPTGRYHIDFVFDKDVTSQQRLVFEAARVRLESIVLSGPPGSVHLPKGSYGCPGIPWTQINKKGGLTFEDMLIFVRVAPIDGPNQVLGSSGPCRFSYSPQFPRAGIMQFDSADVSIMMEDDSFFLVVLHEMLHVLGFGTEWNWGFKLVDVVATPYRFLGIFANQAQAALVADNPKAATKSTSAVVEDEGGAGTALSHWKETAYYDELMTGWLDTGDNPLSVLTVRSLQDLGYSVNTKNADDYHLPTLATVVENGRRRLRGPREEEEEEEDERQLVETSSGKRNGPRPGSHKNGKKYVDMSGDVYRGERGTVDTIPRRTSRPHEHQIDNNDT